MVPSAQLSAAKSAVCSLLAVAFPRLLRAHALHVQLNAGGKNNFTRDTCACMPRHVCNARHDVSRHTSHVKFAGLPVTRIL